jgi:hypothetical protein
MKIVLEYKERPAFFNGWKTEDATYRFSCAACGAKIAIGFSEMLNAAWSWKEKAEEVEKQSLAQVFHIDLARRSIASGMDAVVRSSCPKCEAVYFAYFWFHEYRNSCYSISIRSIATR